MPVDISAVVYPLAFFDFSLVDEHTHVFPLSSSTLLKVNKGHITKWFFDGRSDAIVNSTNKLMFADGGGDLDIHRAAGPKLGVACYNIPEVKPGVRCPTGEARITPGFKLPASCVIHTVGPIHFIDKNPAASLRNAYRNSLMVAKANKIEYIAFPAICCGAYGQYPLKEAATIAICTVKEFANDFKEMHFVLYVDKAYNFWLDKTRELLLH
ncbi:hypothetical protein P3X46_014496 [Hevea brasiliensis]|uniref:Macro domain-containing protein n=1 Tax=Hevea brasiliensis TaxID=3981 RepID=A0ABQ9M6X9_HEVBR|nr:hypothetical protein P3X46_014496 [Hevea brasiliensis]